MNKTWIQEELEEWYNARETTQDSFCRMYVEGKNSFEVEEFNRFSGKTVKKKIYLCDHCCQPLGGNWCMKGGEEGANIHEGCVPKIKLGKKTPTW